MIYPHHYFTDILNYCQDEHINFWEYVDRFEEPSVWEHLANVWQVMRKSVGVAKADGVLPGGLNLRRKAGDYIIHSKNYTSNVSTRGMVYAYAGVSEEMHRVGCMYGTNVCGSSGFCQLFCITSKHRETSPSV